MKQRRKATARTGLAALALRARPGDPARGILAGRGLVVRCALGRSGIKAFKREGDGATPRARLRILGGYFRPGTGRRPTRLPLSPIRTDFGWCDAPDDRNYNRPVRLPYRASHECMWRTDGLYDVCLILDWNIRPRRRNAGSAIFLHLARPGYAPTEGCLAVSPADMRRLLALLCGGCTINIVG